MRGPHQSTTAGSNGSSFAIEIGSVFLIGTNVTLGGTELRDIQSLHYIDSHCTTGIVSYEFRPTEFDLACQTRDKVQPLGLNVEIRHGDIFDFQRVGDEPHLFFIDLKGCCVLSEYDVKFAELLSDEHVRPGDSLLITSHLGAQGLEHAAHRIHK